MDGIFQSQAGKTRRRASTHEAKIKDDEQVKPRYENLPDKPESQ